MPTSNAPETSGPQFPKVGGRVCLDLVATLGRRHATPVERLPDRHTLARWLAAAGLLPTPPPVTASQLTLTRELRESVNRIVRAAMNGQDWQREDVARVNDVAAWPDLAPQIGTDGAHPELTWQHHDAADAALAIVARDAVALVTDSQQMQRVKECAHADCSLLFLDKTQSTRRRWCSMNRCGNLVKTTNYRARRGSSDGADT